MLPIFVKKSRQTDQYQNSTYVFWTIPYHLIQDHNQEPAWKRNMSVCNTNAILQCFIESLPSPGTPWLLDEGILSIEG